MRRILVLLPVLAALALPGIAHAGCIATPGPVTFNVPAVNTSTHVGCTSNNGEHYELRIYLQRDSILDPNHYTIAWPTPVSYHFDHPPTGFVHDYLAGFGCQIFDGTLLHARNKSVLENLVTGSQAVTTGPVANVPFTCL